MCIRAYMHSMITVVLNNTLEHTNVNKRKPH